MPKDGGELQRRAPGIPGTSTSRPLPYFDAGALWRTLPRTVQRRLGRAALELALGLAMTQAAAQHGTRARPYERSVERAMRDIGLLAEPMLFDGRPAPLPGNLGPICRRCGCSELDACVGKAGACWWVEADLCSACARQKRPAGAGPGIADGAGPARPDAGDGARLRGRLATDADAPELPAPRPVRAASREGEGAVAVQGDGPGGPATACGRRLSRGDDVRGAWPARPSDDRRRAKTPKRRERGGCDAGPVEIDDAAQAERGASDQDELIE